MARESASDNGVAKMCDEWHRQQLAGEHETLQYFGNRD